jgi:hypothetical protein
MHNHHHYHKLPLTTRRQIGAYAVLSFFSLSVSYPNYHMGFSFSLFSAVFFAPSVLPLSLFARIIRAEDKESSFAGIRGEINQRKKRERKA